MKKDIWIGKKNLRFYYYRYRDSSYYSISLIVFTILACFVLIFQVIIPQINNWFSIRNEVITTQETIRILNSNINLMRSLDKAALDAQLQIASSTIPPEKDFGTILNALADASISSGVSLQDFTFQVGDITSSVNQAVNISQKELSTVTLTVVVNGKLDGVKRFIERLGKKIPISEVTTLDGSVDSLSMKMQFYQKKLPDIEFRDKETIQPLSNEKKNLLEELATWKTALPVQTIGGVSASESASGIPLF